MPTDLEQRSFGSTGEKVSVIGLGGGYLDKYSLAEGVNTVHRALELGVNYFDTSPDYIHGASQVILANALKGRREPYLLATKLGYHMPKQELHRSREAITLQFYETLRVLRRNHVDLLQIHEADLSGWWVDGAPKYEYYEKQDPKDLSNAPVLQVLYEAKQQGKCRWIGITGNHPPALANLLSQLEVDTCLSAYAHNLIFRLGKNLVGNIARQKKIAYIVGGIFSCGLTEVKREWIDNPPHWMKPVLHRRLPRLYELQKESGISLTHLGVRYLLADPHISVILIGAARGIELEDAVNAARQGLLPADLQQALDELGVDESPY